MAQKTDWKKKVRKTTRKEWIFLLPSLKVKRKRVGKIEKKIKEK